MTTPIERFREAFVGHVIVRFRIEGMGDPTNIEIDTDTTTLRIRGDDNGYLYIAIGRTESESLSQADALVYLAKKTILSSVAETPRKQVLLFSNNEQMIISSEPDMARDHKLTYTLVRMNWEPVT